MNFVKICTHNLIFEYSNPLYILGEYNYQAFARFNNFYCFIAHGSYPGLLPPAFQPLTLLGVFVISFVFLLSHGSSGFGRCPHFPRYTKTLTFEICFEVEPKKTPLVEIVYVSVLLR